MITVSEWGAEYLRRHHRMTQVHAVPNGVDTVKFRPGDPQERAALRERLGFKGFTVLNPARMSIEKNHPAVIATAWQAPELHFVLVGTGYLEPALKRAAPRNVTFLGKRHDMPDLYRAADVVLQPTIAENQSLATLEALSSGTPVVTNDIPAQRELIRMGQEGLLVRGGAPATRRPARPGRPPGRPVPYGLRRAPERAGGAHAGRQRPAPRHAAEGTGSGGKGRALTARDSH